MKFYLTMHSIVLLGLAIWAYSYLLPKFVERTLPPMTEEVYDEESKTVEIFSPKGDRSADIFSATYDDVGNTQVMVTFGHPKPNGGSGVFSVNLPYVPLKVEWRDDDNLVISYPKGLVPNKGPNYHKAQNYKEVVNIHLETYEGAENVIAELDEKYNFERYAARQSKLVRSKSSDGLRGSISSYSDSQFEYRYYDVDEEDHSADWLNSLGYQGGGPSWEGIIYGLLKINDPSLLNGLFFDSEGDGTNIRASNRKPLKKIQKFVTEAKNDQNKILEAIKVAEKDGRME